MANFNFNLSTSTRHLEDLQPLLHGFISINKKPEKKTLPDDFLLEGTLPKTNIAPENGWLEY